MSHLTEASSHSELGKDGQVLVLAEGNVDLSGFNLIYRPGNNAAMNDLERLRESTKLLFPAPTGLILHFTLLKTNAEGN